MLRETRSSLPWLRLLLTIAPLARTAQADDECAWALRLARVAPRKGTFLDVGAGACPCRELVEARRPDVRYLAQDLGGFQKETVAAEGAAEKILSQGYCPPHGLDIVSDITDIPIPDATIDVVYCNSVLEHVPDVISALQEMARVARPGGYLFVVMPFGGGLHNLPYHYYAGVTHRWFQHYGHRFGLDIVNHSYSFTPWVTDAPRISRLGLRWADCLHQNHRNAQKVVGTAAYIIQEMKDCEGTKDRRVNSIAIDNVTDSDLEFEFPDAIEVVFRRSRKLIRRTHANLVNEQLYADHVHQATDTLKKRNKYDIMLSYHIGEIAHLHRFPSVWKNWETASTRSEKQLPCLTLAYYPKPGMSWAVAGSAEDFDWGIVARGHRVRPPRQPHQRVLQPVATREDLGAELRRLGLRGIGVEVGVQMGSFSYSLLSGWAQAALFVQVDLWSGADNYRDSASTTFANHMTYQQTACAVGITAVEYRWAQAVAQCKSTSLLCAEGFTDDTLDFVYIDARHDRLSVLRDLKAYWPKLRVGGVIAGHDYTPQYDEFASQDPQRTGQDWSLNSDGTVDTSRRAVKGAVDDFFSGSIPEAPEDLRQQPRQVVVTYRELKWNTWIVLK